MDISILRNLVIRYGAKLGMKSNEQVCLWHLLDHDFTGKGYVFPSETRIAELMGLESNRQVKRLIHDLEEKKYISVRRTKGFANRYSFKGIVKSVLPYLKDELKKERQRLEKMSGDKNVPGEQNNPGQKCPQVVTKMSPGWGHKCPPKHCNRSTANKHTYIVPENGADKSVDLKIEKNSFVVLLDFWYSEKGEPNPGTVPPRFDRKKYTELVAERITEGWTWRQLSAAVRNYWRVVKSPAHYYKHQGSISWFIAKGIDQFWDELKPWENFMDKNKRAPSVGYNAPPEDLSELTIKEFGLA